MMPLPPEFQVTEAEDTIRIEWDNKQVAKDDWGCCWLVFAWLLFGSLTLVVTREGGVGLTTGKLNELGGMCCLTPVLWCFFLLVPYWLSQRTWFESVELTRDALTHTRIGWFAPKSAVYPLAKVTKLAIGWYRNAEWGGGSTAQVRIYVVWNVGWGTTDFVLVQWLADPLQEQLFQALRDFATRNDIPLAFDEWGRRPDWAQQKGIGPGEATNPE